MSDDHETRLTTAEARVAVLEVQIGLVLPAIERTVVHLTRAVKGLTLASLADEASYGTTKFADVMDASQGIQSAVESLSDLRTAMKVGR